MLRSVHLFNIYVNIPKTHVHQSNQSPIYEPETSLTIQGQLANFTNYLSYRSRTVCLLLVRAPTRDFSVPQYQRGAELPYCQCLLKSYSHNEIKTENSYIFLECCSVCYKWFICAHHYFNSCTLIIMNVLYVIGRVNYPLIPFP